jgi:hypothetical protein
VLCYPNAGQVHGSFLATIETDGIGPALSNLVLNVETSNLAYNELLAYDASQMPRDFKFWLNSELTEDAAISTIRTSKLRKDRTKLNVGPASINRPASEPMMIEGVGIISSSTC